MKKASGKCPCRCHLSETARPANEQELLAEVQRYHRLMRDSDTARIKMNHARIDAESALAAAQERIAALGAAAGMLANTVALLNSMIRSGEDHSPTSERVMRESLDAYGAALAGSQGGGGETRQDVACTETVHRVQEGADACDCGENRMELML